jgi:hypothetical protein
MAKNIIQFPNAQGARFREAVDYYLSMCYPGFSEEEKEELKGRLVAVVDKYKSPGMALRLPAEAIHGPEHAAMIKQAADKQIATEVQPVFHEMLTEVLFLHCYSYSLEREIARLDGGTSGKN